MSEPFGPSSRSSVSDGAATSGGDVTWPPEPDAPEVMDGARQLGNYRLLEQVGTGGMGVVYRAEQLRPVQRIVALKLIKLGMDTREVVARFESERQALARLEHPGIARVYDAASTETGRPYFVMEYIAGQPVTTYCDQRRLTMTRRLELFAQVCQAVQHAHFKGILHRDLKPSNILVAEVDGNPQPKVIDFGVAKATQEPARADATQVGQLVGTPAYMSPEQAAGSGDVDTRADVYSLGIVLYELLAGALPFEPTGARAGSAGEMIPVAARAPAEPTRPSLRLSTLAGDAQRVASHRGLESPSALRRRLRGDLDRIVVKAIAPDRSQRYETAAALAEDIRRHLANEPIAARPPTLVYQARKFTSRNRTLVAASLAVLLAIIIGAVAATYGLFRARQALADAQASQRAAREVNQFLAGMLSSVDPAKAQGDKVLVRDVLDQAAIDLKTEFTDQPIVAASLHAIVGHTYHALGLLEPALTHWTSARDLRRAALGPEHSETLDAENSVATTLSALGRRAEAEAILRELIPRRRRLAGPEHPSTLIAEETLALLLANTERGAEADPLLRHVVETRRRSLGQDHPDTLLAMHNLSATAEQLGRDEEAVELNRDVAAGRERVLGPNHPSTILSLNNLATTLLRLDRAAEAEPVLREALERNERVLGPNHSNTLASLNNLSAAYRQLGRLEEAERTARHLIERLATVLPENHPNTLASLGGLALVLEDRGKIDEALDVYADVYRRARAGELPAVQVVWYVTPYGMRLVKYGRFDRAEAPLLEGLRVLEASGKYRTRRTIDVIDALVQTYEQTGKPEEAARWRAEAGKLRAEEAASTRPATAPIR